MEFDSSAHYTGEIIYLNEKYGFIQSNQFGSLYFKASFLSNIKLLDIVSFVIEVSQSYKHKGKFIAQKIKLISRGKYSDYQRLIGKITSWNGKFGYISSPQLSTDVFLFHTRLVENTTLKVGNLVVFSPVKSSKNDTQLFTFFAYSIDKEADIAFLCKQFTENNLLDLGNYLKLKLSSVNRKNIDTRLYLKCQILILGEITSGNYSQLEKIFKNIDVSQLIKLHDIIEELIPTNYQILLFEKNIISTYNKLHLKDYFFKTSADSKRVIAEKLSGTEDLTDFLGTFLYNLEQQNKLSRINNDLKTFLDIVNRIESTKHTELYEKALRLIEESMSPKEIILLWSNDYISKISDSFIRQNIDLGNTELIDKIKQKQGDIDYLLPIYEEYLLHSDLSDFLNSFPKYITHTNTFKKQYPTRYKEIEPAIKSRFSSNQKFVLTLFGLDWDFNNEEYYYSNQDDINVYFRLKFLLNANETTGYESITEIDLVDYILTLPWNECIQPLLFLQDVEAFNKKFSVDISTNNLSNNIFESIPKYTTHHIQLWLYDYVDDTKYDYVGFRNSFYKLEEREQEMLKERGDYKGVFNVENYEITEVVPCTDFINLDSYKKYFAHVENIYFYRGEIKLRNENKDYTNPYKSEFSSTGINRIPKNSKLNDIKITITVDSKNNIISEDGLEELYTAIHTGFINRTLSKVVAKNKIDKKSVAYVEDWELRKKVINYLNDNQSLYTKALIVNEPKNHFRRIDNKSDVDCYEKTCLYSIPLNDDFLIVWENLDFTHDRSTYLFKASKETHLNQLEKIRNAIVSYGQLRATLSINTSSSDVINLNKLILFKRNLGVITKIKKRRGRNAAFEDWLSNLTKASQAPTPELPTKEELVSLEKEELINTHYILPSKKTKIKQVDVEKTTSIFDNDYDKTHTQSSPKNESENTTTAADPDLTLTNEMPLLKKIAKNEYVIYIPKGKVLESLQENNYTLVNDTLCIYYEMSDIYENLYADVLFKRTIKLPHHWNILTEKLTINNNIFTVTFKIQSKNQTAWI